MLKTRNLIAVPRDLASVTHQGARETRPQDAELKAGSVDKIWRAVEAMYRTGLHPGIQLVVRRRGKVVLDRSIGHASGNGPGDDAGGIKAPLTPDIPVCLFSASKAVTAVLAHKMIEQGKFRLDDRVADYLPEYGVHGKGQTTVRELLAHRAGIPSLPVKEVDPKLLTDWEEVIRLLCGAKASSGAAQQQSYHAVTAGYIVGELVRRVSGRSLPQVLREELAEPLGCRHFTYGLPEAERETSLALSYSTGPRAMFPLNLVAKRALGVEFEALAPLSNTPDFLSAVVPAANIFSTADESSRFYEMLLCGGTFNGRRILKPETVAAAVQPAGKIQIDRTLLVPVRFSPGFILGERPFGLYGGSCAKAYGHLGFINIVCWADPERDISVALLNTGKSTAPTSIPSLGRVLWSVAHYCPPVKEARRHEH